ncbi:transglycosylase SLT domain-containing protein [Sphingomonas sp. AP4-R1]|nr:transglycosylase SLT domain-containing protein [Sphingomonas sp. AP4-R1]
MEPNRDHRSPELDRSPPDRDARASLSSVVGRYVIPAALLLSIGTAATALTMRQPGVAPEGLGTPPAPPQSTIPPLPPETDPLWGAINSWDRLRQSDSLPFADYASFLLAHRGWPGEMALRRAAERAIQPDVTDPRLVATFLTTFPPQTGAGRVRLAEALAASGRMEEARAAAAAAWIGGTLSPDDEARLTAKFGPGFTQADQDKRMERLLWSNATAAAQRQIALVSPARQPLYAARLAFQTRAPDAGSITVSGADRDPGYAIDRANWLRNTAQSPAMRAYLSQTRSWDAAPFDPEIYLKTLLTAAQGAATDNQSTLAYDIAGNADAAFATGTLVRDRPLSERDPYTSLVWLAGQTALKKLNRPRDAEAMFVRYATASQTSGSQTKGEYWAGRAAEAAGDRPGAQAHYANAARNVDQFYGQLATERLGKSIAVPADPPAVAVPTATRSAFFQSEIVRAARLLGKQRRWQDQTQFVRTIALNAKTDQDHVLAGELAREIARPDLGVIVSRQARTSGARDPIRIGFPTIPVPPVMESHWTMIHAISRQESQFDREALSHANAKGLMQLMNPTAKEQAGKLGMPWDPARLTADPGYNVMLGSSFFDRMLTYYNGSYVLAVASYNAGPGNVNKFVRANGDPRMPGVDVVDWIEAIPLSETRGYVQKVLENAVVYDLFNPERAKTPEKDRLSYYLGKKSAG